MKNKAFIADTGAASEQEPKENEDVAMLKREVEELRAQVKKEAVDATPQEHGVKVSGGNTSTNFASQKRYDIRIEMQENEPHDVKVGVNGIVFQIRRGVTVTVPACVVEVLRNAVATKLTIVPNYPKADDFIWSDAGMFPMQILKGPY